MKLVLAAPALRDPEVHAPSLGIARLAEALRARDHHVTLLALEDDTPRPPHKLGGARVTRIPKRILERTDPTRGSVRWWEPWRIRPAVQQAVRLLHQEGLEVIHIFGMLPLGLAVPPELPTVITLDGPDADRLQASPSARRQARGTAHRVEVLAANSIGVADVAKQTLGVEIMPAFATRSKTP